MASRAFIESILKSHRDPIEVYRLDHKILWECLLYTIYIDVPKSVGNKTEDRFYSDFLFFSDK